VTHERAFRTLPPEVRPPTLINTAASARCNRISIGWKPFETVSLEHIPVNRPRLRLQTSRVIRELEQYVFMYIHVGDDILMFRMSLHSYSRVWLHVIWATLDRRPLLSGAAAAKVSGYLTEYAPQKGIYLKINYVNRDHVHVLLDLPTNLCIEDALHLLKGSSSHWINENSLLPGKFAWGRGYGVFSVSHSAVSDVAEYIANQEKHHHKRSFAQEFELFLKRYDLQWHDDRD
jgi:putative transposase